MSDRSLQVFAPATVANVACGFDIFGFALECPGDELSVALVDQHAEVVLSKITGEKGRLPLDPAKNTAGVSVKALLVKLGIKQGVEIELHKKMPLGSGLGSSAASAAGAVFAVNKLLGNPLTVQELVPFAMEGERVACGTAHADNVAPALMGGFVLIRGYDPLDIVNIPCAIELYCAILHPHMEIRTQEARRILKKEIALGQHIVQTGNAVGLAVGLLEGDMKLISHSLKDVIIEPQRAELLPGFYDIQEAALASGALGCSFSGSGPAMFALTSSRESAQHIGDQMKKACELAGHRCDLYISKLNEEGPRIIS